MPLQAACTNIYYNILSFIIINRYNAHFPGSKGLDMPNNVGLPLFHKQRAMAIHMEIHFDNPTFKENMTVSGGVRFYYMNDQLENKAGILELGDPILSLNGDEINDGMTKYQFTCGGDCSRTFASGSNNNNGVTVFNEFLHMHKTGIRMTNEVVRGDNVVHSAAVDVYDFPQQGGFHTPQSSYELLSGDGFRTTCYYRDGDRFGIDSDEEMCIAYVMYYPVLESLGFTWSCPYIGDRNGGQVLDSIGCASELEFSDIDNVGLGRTFGTSNDRCDATESPSKAPTTLSPTISKPPSPNIMACSFCKDGLTVEPSTEVPGADGASCGEVNAYAAFLTEGSNQCTEVKGAEVICCHSSNGNPCSFCKDGLTGDSSDLEVPGADGATCSDLNTFAAFLTEGSSQCTEVKGAEILCCPSGNVCPFCTEGLTAEPSLEVPGADGATCEDLVTYASFIEEESTSCDEVKGAEILCCPSGNVCPFCSDGLLVESSTLVPGADGATCGEIIDYAAFVQEGSTTCDDVLLGEIICCPKKAESPCTFCKVKNGLTVDSSTVVPGADGFTCGDLISFSVSLEDTSDTCTEVKLAEFICCPSFVIDDEEVSSKSPSTRPTDVLQEITSIETDSPTSRPTDSLEVPTNASVPFVSEEDDNNGEVTAIDGSPAIDLFQPQEEDRIAFEEGGTSASSDLVVNCTYLISSVLVLCLAFA